MKIINSLPFCLCGNDLGIADEGTFAARCWRISDEAFNEISGRKFSWIAPDGGSYTEHRDEFIRPTEEQIIKYITPPIKKIALEQGLIED